MFRVNWLVLVPSKKASVTPVATMIGSAQGMGFRIFYGKSLLSPSLWDSQDCTPHLSPDPLHRVWCKQILVLTSFTFTRTSWESLLGSLTVVVVGVPFGWIRHMRLVWEGNSVFPIWHRVRQVVFPVRLHCWL